MKIAGIYQIRNIVNNKIYIGSSANLMNRKSGHFCMLRKNKHDNSYLQYAYNKYGADSFSFEILCILDSSPEILFLFENMFINYYKSNNSKFGYNLRKEAETNIGSHRFFPMTEETKRKIGDGRRGKIHSEETKQKMRNTKGRRKKFTMPPRTEEHRKNISEAKSGVKLNLSDEQHEFRRTSILGTKNPNAKLNPEKVREIRNMLNSGVSVKDVAKYFDVEDSIIYRIRANKMWKEVE